jgi:hypothetical protein
MSWRYFSRAASWSAFSTSAAGSCALAAEFGRIWQSSVKEAARGGIGRWLPMGDMSGLATAWSHGRLFPVTTADLAAWVGEGSAGGAREAERVTPLARTQEATANIKEVAKASLQALRTRLPRI